MKHMNELTRMKPLRLLLILLILALLVACDPVSGEQPTASPIANTATPVVDEPTPTVDPDGDGPTPTVVSATATVVAPTAEPTATAPTPATPTVPATATAVATVTVVAPTTTPATDEPAPTRISFESGAYTALVPGNLAAGASDHYVLLASEAQLMAVLAESTAANLSVSVQGADGQILQTLEEGHDGWSGHLPSTQDYRLTVKASGEAADYVLQVTIAFEEMPPMPERIVHEGGAAAATVQGTVPPFTYIPYTLFAEAGQNIRIEISSSNGSSNFTLLGLSDGQPYKRIEFPETVWEIDSPISQDYEITVRSRFGDDYALTVTLDPAPLPVIVNPDPAPSDTCLAVHPGGDAPAVNIYDGPGEQFAIIARLGNWAEVVKISGPWMMTRLEPGKFGWTSTANADMVGPCQGLNAPLLVTTAETPVYSSPEAAGEPLFSYGPQEIVDPLGRNADSSWWAVFVPGDGNIPPGWIAAENVTVVGSAGDAPIFDSQ